LSLALKFGIIPILEYNYSPIMFKPLIEIKNLYKTFGSNTVLKNISFDIHQGEFLTLLGPSGCGKTTLLRLLSGFEIPSQGQMFMDGQLINQTPPQRRNMHTIFQYYALFPHLNVFENVAFSLKCQKIPNNEIKIRVKEALKLVQLDGFQERNVQFLSGGQQQRVAIARAIINKPKVLLLDEPLSSLDYRLRKKMQVELKKLQKELKMTFVFVTHDQEEALSMSDRIIIFNQGQIEQIGSPHDIYENPKSLYVAKFIGETNTFNISVLEMTNEHIITKIAGVLIQCKRIKNVCNGDPLYLLVRPEDIRVYHITSETNIDQKITGKVIDVTYKGSTVDLMVELSTGQIVSTSEFFDEEHEKLEYTLNEKVYIEWLTGWEVLLPYEH
jgi:spermidine/putrescine transport system ATP-binding protein